MRYVRTADRQKRAEVLNVPEYAYDYKYIVYREADGDKWYWGAWNELDKAFAAATDIGGKLIESEKSRFASKRVAKNSDELKQEAIRVNMKLENDAIITYSSYINQLPKGDAIRVGLEAIRDEEKKHVGELQALIEKVAPDERALFLEGMGEVEEEDE